MILPRPSKAPTWVRCAGSVRLSAQAPDWHDDDEDVAVREEGTACHWAAHQHVITGQRVALDTLAPNGVPITEEMHDAHDTYFAAVAEWGVAQAYFELPVTCHRVHHTCQGTLDVGAYCPERRTIFIGDLKFGYRFVDVYENWQLLCYAVGLQHYLGLESDLDLWFEFLIVQPRSYHNEGPVRRWRVRATDVRAHINILAGAYESAIAPVAVCKVNPGCGRCDGRHQCTTIQSAAGDVEDASYAATPHELPFPAAENELRRLQRARDIIDARITGLEGQVTHAIRNGTHSTRYAVEQSAPRLAWRDDAARATIINVGKLLGVELTQQKLITPTQAKKLLPAAYVDANSYRPPGQLRLIPIESSRVMRTIRKNQNV